MERLTNHFDYCVFIDCKYRNAELDKKNQCDFFNMTSRDKCHDKRIYDKLVAYEDAEEQGLLLRLPCKLGGKLYDITEFFNIEGYQEIYEMDARKIEISRDKEGLIYTIDGADYREKDFGKVLFKTEAEAEKAIREMGE